MEGFPVQIQKSEVGGLAPRFAGFGRRSAGKGKKQWKQNACDQDKP